jgi:hypothetical protein
VIFMRGRLRVTAPCSRMRSDTLLRRLARFLPSNFREQVFEPALNDIEFDEASSLRISAPQFIWRNGRPTKLGSTLLTAAALIALLIQRINYGNTTPPH